MSHGYIGFHLQSEKKVNLKRVFDRLGTMFLNQVIVDENDKDFDNLLKPIDSFFNYEEAQIMEQEKSIGWLKMTAAVIGGWYPAISY